ncbi:MAG: DNA polymerase III subunit gamma/tau [Candidatus Eremiobacteraeota bacterium]|nr:DNA polymerase III subunit gamma/tau [Candidatus Eremiobacteraeota bacterium]MBV9409830.1 DNA polymerase III subunit gamma/tau [Candidatus Eremiobacteraeota bacterium]
MCRNPPDGTGLRSPESTGVSLYRTWRPRTFADLVGQDAVVKTLTTALETGRLAHAYLFSGPRGSGKTSAAKILARCIECVNGPTATPDNTCPNCVAILEGTALDVLEIDAASNRGIDEIRALRDAVKFAPSVMRKKVYIIDEAHMLTKEGANAFLKTLEEPPEWAVFVLATTAPEALPPTILSRCQRYAFRRIAIPTMIARMREIANAEGIVIDDAALGAIAYRADGGLRDALTMLEQVAAFANGPVDGAVVDAAFGQTGRELARALRDAALDGDAAQTLRIVDEASDAGTDMTGLIRSTIAEFRHLLVARVNPELLARDLAEDDAQSARERAAVTPQARLVRALRLLADALAAARGSGNARLEVESAVLRFVLQGEDPSLDALAARAVALESGDAATPRPAPAPVPAKPAVKEKAAPPPPPPAPAPTAEPVAKAPEPEPEPAPAPPPPVPAPQKQQQPAVAPMELSLQKLRTLWQNIRTRAESEKTSLRAGLSRATVASLEGDVLTLRVPDPMASEVLKKDAATVKKAIADVTGRALDLRVAVGAGGPPPETGVSNDDGEEQDDLMRYALEKLS